MRKYKLFGVIPIFDIVLVLIVIAVAFIGIKIVNTSKSGVSYTTSETKEAEITVKFSNLSNAIVTEPSQGESVIETTTNNSIGTVISFEKEPYTVYDFDSVSGNPVSTIYSDRYNLTVKIKSNITISDIQSSINGTTLGIGKTLALSMPSFCGNGVILNIKEVNK